MNAVESVVADAARRLVETWEAEIPNLALEAIVLINRYGQLEILAHFSDGSILNNILIEDVTSEEMSADQLGTMILDAALNFNFNKFSREFTAELDRKLAEDSE